jgi:hypothetical protein
MGHWRCGRLRSRWNKRLRGESETGERRWRLPVQSSVVHHGEEGRGVLGGPSSCIAPSVSDFSGAHNAGRA